MYCIAKIKYTFYAEDGSSVSAVVIGEGMDSGDKASNKAMAVAMKYAMFQVFCIPTEEMPDPDATTPEPSLPKTEVKPENKKEPVPAPRCMRCGSYITPGKTKDGKVWPAVNIAKYSEHRYNGAVYCIECMKLIDSAGKDSQAEKRESA